MYPTIAAPLRRSILLRSSSVLPAVGTKCTMATVPGREPLLFTPGPLTTSITVKQAMLIDYGSRDAHFINAVKEVRHGLLKAAGVSQDQGWECVIMQGSGTFGVESMIGTSIPREGAKLLVCINGAYGHRALKIAKTLGIPSSAIEFTEKEAVNAEAVAKAVEADPDITHVITIHHETTTGVVNNLEAIGNAVKSVRKDAVFLVDSMSGFGAIPVDLEGAKVDYLVSSSNKNIEGVPGFSFALARRSHFETTEGNARSVALDLYDQWKGLEASGQFRFTPPTHSMLAFRQALAEFEAEGGVKGREARYRRNFEVLRDGMKAMGFELYLPEDVQSCIISTFLFPDDPNFNFKRFYDELSKRSYVIYPGKLTKADCFRIGSIGRLFEHDMKGLLLAIREVLSEMGVKLPVKQIKE